MRGGSQHEHHTNLKAKAGLSRFTTNRTSVFGKSLQYVIY